VMIMALLKSSKVRDFADAELKAKLFEYQKEMNSERGLLASGGRTSNPGKLRELRKTIARIITIMHERKLGLVRGAKTKKAPQAVPAKK
jgi:large subunit ribosomal protein L29